MSIRVDTSSWIAGAIVCGDRGLGMLGSEVPSSGDDGAGYVYNDLTLPADANKEVCGRITSWPSAGTLFAYEDTSFEFTGAPDGSYTFGYTLYVDGVSSGSATVTLEVGATIRTTTATARTLERGSAATTTIRTAAVAALTAASGTAAVTSVRTGIAAGRIASNAETTFSAIVAGTFAAIGRAIARGTAAYASTHTATAAATATTSGAASATTLRDGIAAGRLDARSAVTAAALVAGTVTTSVAAQIGARASVSNTTERSAALAAMLALCGATPAAPELPVIVPPSTRTLSPDHTRLGLSPVAPSKPRLG